MLSYLRVPHYGPLAVILLITAVLTDVLDGVVARQLGVSTQKLRRLDSTIDQLFWLLAVLATWLACPGFFSRYSQPLLMLVGAEALTYAISFLRFKKEVATHTFAAKAWLLVLLATLVQLTLSCQAGVLFWSSLWLGLASRLEIALILLTLRNWAADVPTLYHAWLLRRGRPIRRHKLFHG